MSKLEDSERSDIVLACMSCGRPTVWTAPAAGLARCENAECTFRVKDLTEAVMIRRERQVEQICADQDARRAWCDTRLDFEALSRAQVEWPC